MYYTPKMTYEPASVQMTIGGERFEGLTNFAYVDTNATQETWAQPIVPPPAEILQSIRRIMAEMRDDYTSPPSADQLSSWYSQPMPQRTEAVDPAVSQPTRQRAEEPIIILTRNGRPARPSPALTQEQLRRATRPNRNDPYQSLCSREELEDPDL